MSFGGHALDMIKRLKENRQPMKARRERRNELLQKMNRRDISGSINPNITAEEWGRVSKELREHEVIKERYYVRMTFIIFGILLIIGLLLFLIFAIL